MPSSSIIAFTVTTPTCTTPAVRLSVPDPTIILLLLLTVLAPAPGYWFTAAFFHLLAKCFFLVSAGVLEY